MLPFSGNFLPNHQTQRHTYCRSRHESNCLQIRVGKTFPICSILPAQMNSSTARKKSKYYVSYLIFVFISAHRFLSYILSVVNQLSNHGRNEFKSRRDDFYIHSSFYFQEGRSSIIRGIWENSFTASIFIGRERLIAKRQLLCRSSLNNE